MEIKIQQVEEQVLFRGFSGQMQAWTPSAFSRLQRAKCKSACRSSRHFYIFHMQRKRLTLSLSYHEIFKRYDTGLKKANKRIDVLEQILSKQEYLVEGGFSVADVAVASYLLYVPQFFQDIDLGRWPNIVSYMKRCAERPAYGQAFGTNVQKYLISSLDAMGGQQDKKFFGIF